VGAVNEHLPPGKRAVPVAVVGRLVNKLLVLQIKVTLAVPAMVVMPRVVVVVLRNLEALFLLALVVRVGTAFHLVLLEVQLLVLVVAVGRPVLLA
jgi:hypothetical protein